MSIRIEDVQKAMRMLDNPREYLFCEALHKQLAGSLEVYEGRGEYDGTLASALECLRLAEYEVGDV